MKYQKSSYSLHSTSTTPFQERSTNIFHTHASKLQLKRDVSYSKQTSYISNARGRLSHCSQLHTQLLALCREVERTNKDLGLQIESLREGMGERALKEVQGDLTKDVKELRKQVTIRKRSDMLRYESVQQILHSMWKGHKQLKKKVEEIEDRVIILENVMGGPSPT